MDCARCREAVSATLDGEYPGVPQLVVDQHVFACPACRGWVEAAAEVTRRARLVAAPPVPDVTAAVLGRLPAAGRRLPGKLLDVALRLALLAVGAGQLAVGIAAFSAGSSDMAAPAHLAHETGAWNVGLAACFLGVAVLPRLAAGALPFLLSFTAVLAVVTLGDLGAGHVPAARAGVHLLVVGGAVLVSALALRARTPRRGPLGALRDRPARWGRRRSRVAPAVPGPGLRGVPADPAATARRAA